MAADGEPQEDGAGSDSTDSSGASSSSPGSPSPATLPPPRPPPPLPLPLSLPQAPPPAPPASCSSAAASAPLPLHPHLYFQHQQRLLSLHLSSPSPSPATPIPIPIPAQQRPPLSAPLPTITEPSPAPPAPDRPFRDDCWSENATLTLIQAWGDRYLELNRGNLKQKHWKDVANSVNSRPLTASKPPKTDVQCKNRLDTLKKKYKIEKSKLVTGGAPSKWAFFDRLDELIGSSKKPKTPPLGKAPCSVPVAADGNCTTNPDGPCTGTSATKCTMEQDVKPPLLFIPPQATTVVPLPPINHHVGSGGIPLPSINHHVGSGGAHMNHHAASGPHISHHGGTPIHHHAGEGAHMNHLASGATAMNHHVDEGAAADTASKSKGGPDMSHSSPPHSRPVDDKGAKRKRDGLRPGEDSPFRDLARAISKFGDVYERVEIAKLQQMMELEKQRMEFTKDLEIQRLQLFMQTQVELAKMKHGSSNTEHCL